MTSPLFKVSNKLTFAPVKKDAFRKRTALGNFLNIRREIIAEQPEQVVGKQQERAEVFGDGFSTVGSTHASRRDVHFDG